MIDLKRVLIGEIRDLERIIAANEAMLKIENSPAKRQLTIEIGDLEEKIERLRERIQGSAD